MPALVLAPPTPADAAELEAFEFGNRAFFEAHINARPAGYYLPGGVMAAIEAAQREAAEDRSYQFLARDPAGQLVARVNLSRVRRQHFHSAEIGYRVAQAHGRQGYAGQLVRLATDLAFGELGLQRVEACARAENIGSVKALLRNGFTQFGRSIQSFELAGCWHDLLHFERRDS